MRKKHINTTVRRGGHSVWDQIMFRIIEADENQGQVRPMNAASQSVIDIISALS